MRLVELGRIVAQAEALRWRRLLRRQAIRGVFAAIGAVFALAMLAGLHVAGALALATQVGGIYAVLIVAGVDLVMAGIFFALASSDKPDRIEIEAVTVRNEARAQMTKAATMSMLLMPPVRRAGFSLLGRMFRSRRAAA